MEGVQIRGRRLEGRVEPLHPPQPFDENTFGFPNRAFTGAELLGYVDYCGARARGTLDDRFEEKGARPLPDAHRYRGMRYGVLVGSIPLHVIEHASQIRQFLTTSGVKVQPMAGDGGFA